MEYVKVRKPLARVFSSEDRFGRGADTKGHVVSRRLQKVATAKSIVSKLQVREVGRNGRGLSFASHSQSTPESPEREKDTGFHLPHVHQKTRLEAAGKNWDDDVISRARRRYEERKAMKEKIKADMVALEEEEIEKERAREEKRKKIFDRERAERSKQLEEWKVELEMKEQKKKQREERKKEKEKKRLEEGLKERQEKYMEVLREKERQVRHRRINTLEEQANQDREELDSRQEKTTRGGSGKKSRGKGLGTKSRIKEVRSSYDPAGKLSATAAKQKKPVKRMSDSEIVEMARQLVEGSAPSDSGTAQLESGNVLASLNSILPPSTASQQTLQLNSPNQELDQDSRYSSISQSNQASAEIESWYRQQLRSVEIE